MITIECVPSWDVENEFIIDLIKDTIPLYVGEPSEIEELDYDDEIQVKMTYPELTFRDIDWGELRKFGLSEMVYIIVYDNENNVRKGFWYDEEDGWINQNLNELNNLKII